MEPLITQLKSSDPEIRESALERPGAHAKPGLARTEGITALQAAVSMFPPQKCEWQQV
jgi:hypothetical protein